MSNLISFEEHAKSYKFEENIINTLSARNPLYDFGQDGNHGIAYSNFNEFVCIFFSYIPRGESTTLLDLTDSLNGSNEKERYSSGDWYIKDIFSLDKKGALKIFPLLYSKNKKEGWIEDLHHIIQLESKK